MGCCVSKSDELGNTKELTERVKDYSKPKWTSEQPLTAEELQKKREEYWDTAPHYGGTKEIWDALKAACEADITTAKVIISAAGIIVAAEDMTVCYDERGAKYELPKFAISDPSNLVPA